MIRGIAIVCAVMGIATTAWSQLFTTTNEDFSDGIGSFSPATWDESEGGQAPGSAKIVDVITTDDGGTFTDHPSIWRGQGCTWPPPFTVSFWAKVGSGSHKSHINVLLQNTSTHAVEWIGLYTLPAPFAAEGEVVTESFPDFKSRKSNIWESTTYEEKVANIVAAKGWNESNAAVLMVLKVGVMNGTMWFDDLSVTIDQSSGTTNATTPRAAPASTAGAPLYVIPNGRLSGAGNAMRALVPVVQARNGRTELRLRR